MVFLGRLALVLVVVVLALAALNLGSNLISERAPTNDPAPGVVQRPDPPDIAEPTAIRVPPRVEPTTMEFWWEMDCDRAPVVDYSGANVVLDIQSGQFAVADFYPTDHSRPKQQAVLTAGSWQPLQGLGLGKVWT